MTFQQKNNIDSLPRAARLNGDIYDYLLAVVLLQEQLESAPCNAVQVQ